jgi:hypothetical protein
MIEDKYGHMLTPVSEEEAAVFFRNLAREYFWI